MNKTFKTLVLFLLVAVAGGLYAQSNVNQISERALAPEMLYRALRDVSDASNNHMLGAATLGSSTTNVTWTGTPVYMCNGQWGTLAASNTILTGAAIPTGYYCRYLVWVNSAGTYGVTQGRSYTTDLGDAAYPPAPASSTVFGGVKIYASAATFTPGTSAITAANSSATVTLYNLAHRPVAFTNLQPR